MQHPAVAEGPWAPPGSADRAARSTRPGRRRRRRTPPVNGRSGAVDAVRVLAVVAVVIGHSHPTALWTELTFTWHVPVFFILSGYLFHPGRDAGSELRRRSRTILLPTLGWLTLVTAAWCLHAVVSGADLATDFWHRLAWGGVDLWAPYSAFWFMPVLVAALVLLRLLEGSPAPVAWLVGLAGYLVCLAFQDESASSFWSLLLTPACLLFVLAGRELRRWRGRIPAPLAIGLALLAVSIVAVRAGSDVVNIKAGSFGTPVISVLVAFAITTGLLLTAEVAFSVPQVARTSYTVSRLAATSLPVVLGHMVVLMMLPQPWGWGEIIATMIGLWLAALLIARHPRISRLLL